MTEQIETVIVGGGQAGLAVSHELTSAGVPHTVLERGQVGQTWRGRWDSFCLVTPNWTVQLPGGAYDGDDPDGFMARDDIVAYLERYAAGFDAPVREGVEVSSLQAENGSGFLLDTSAGRIVAKRVIVSTGAYQRPHRPTGASTLPADLFQIDAEQYQNPGSLPPGAVLMIGAGQSGCQIARSSKRPVATRSCPAGGLRGFRAGSVSARCARALDLGSAIATWSGGRSKRAS